MRIAAADKRRSGVPTLENRFAKYSGSVNAPSAAVDSRSLGATKRQLHQVPTSKPVATQTASPRATKARPGKASNNQPLISEAPALIAAVIAQRRRPPRIKSA